MPRRDNSRWAAAAILCVGASVLLGAAKKPATKASQPAAKAATATAGMPPAEQAYKNIKVLKGLPANQLLTVMHSYNDGLGVQCNACHIPTDYASDKLATKRVTREMILLTNRLNAKEPSVKRKVTCYTCHHGNAEPKNAPPANAEAGEGGEAKEGAQ